MFVKVLIHRFVKWYVLNCITVSVSFYIGCLTCRQSTENYWNYNDLMGHSHTDYKRRWKAFLNVKKVSGVVLGGSIVEALTSRQYIIIYRVLGIFAIVWFGSSPIPSPSLPSASCRQKSLLTGWPVGCGRGAKSYDRKKAMILYKSFNSIKFNSIQVMHRCIWSWSQPVVCRWRCNGSPCGPELLSLIVLPLTIP